MEKYEVRALVSEVPNGERLLTPRVLVVEDQIDQLSNYLEAFESAKIQGTYVRSATEGLHLATAQPTYLAAVIDLQLEEFDGERIIKKMREAGIETPVILVSGYSKRELVEKVAREYSNVYFVSKPFHMDELIRIIWKTMASGKVPV